MKKLNVYSLATLALVFTLFSCTKEKSEPSLTSSDEYYIESSENDIETDEMFDEVFDETDDAMQNNSLKSSDAAESGRNISTITNDDGSKTIIITYTNWTHPKGYSNRIKNGKIIINQNGNRADSNFVREISFENFSINGNAISGTQVIERTAENQYKTTLQNCRIDFEDSTYCTRNGERYRYRVHGETTPRFIWDDEFEITGNYTGINRDGDEYTHETVTPLLKKMNWRTIVSGKIKLVIGDDVVTIDFGNGELDHIAVVEYNGVTHVIRL